MDLTSPPLLSLRETRLELVDLSKKGSSDPTRSSLQPSAMTASSVESKTTVHPVALIGTHPSRSMTFFPAGHFESLSCEFAMSVYG